jgi:hypothetical protein
MSVRRLVAAGAAVIAVGVALLYYFAGPTDDASQIRKRLETFAADINASTTDGEGFVARAVHFGSFFADDVEIDLGRGAAPIRGRETVVGMAARLQPRTAAFEIRFEDIGVSMAPDRNAAEVHLTAEFIRRSITTGEQSMDAREFMLDMRRLGDQWVIGRVTAVDTLKQ